ncbi:MAG: hypothetical protein CUN52_02545 [Phototrophicales bacterium]|nr:MAG: hypothetical protein CUN52_02545 [Phototrophicales bacterium]
MSNGYHLLKMLYDEVEISTNYNLSDEQKKYVQIVLENAESHKAVLTALITSLTKKVETPEQDIRYHKIEFEGGYSARGYDTEFITPFMRDYFPRFAMAESGWLTRSIEQPHPFTKDFTGRIRNSVVKEAFLAILHDIQVQFKNPHDYLRAILLGLKQLQSQTVTIILPQKLQFTVNHVLTMLEAHFNYPYKTSGASRLPVLALYAVYQVLMKLPRYTDKQLVSLKKQTTADIKSKSIGDIEILDVQGRFFEALEIKHGKLIDVGMVQIAYEKIRAYPITRYYILTTKTPNTYQIDDIEALCQRILSEHGCEIIINGVIPTLKYYLRLIPDIGEFLSRYSAVLQDEFASGSIKMLHIQQWFKLLNE